MGLFDNAHHCHTSDGKAIVCVCSTGRDHDESQMDQPNVTSPESKTAEGIDLETT